MGNIPPLAAVTMDTMRWTGAAALIALAMAGCGRPEEKPVSITQAMAASTIPPIDRETPARLETATFAVG